MELSKYNRSNLVNYFNRPNSGRALLGFVKIKNDNAEIISELTQCRETLNTSYQTALRLGKIGGNKLCFFMHYGCTNKEHSTRFLEGMTEAMKIVNLFSRIHGWPEAQLYNIRPHKNLKNKMGLKYKYTSNSHFLVVKASSRWAKTPQLLSLFVLLLRCHTVEDIHGAKDYDDFWLKVDKAPAQEGYIRKTDLNYLKGHARLLKQVFSKYNQVFGRLRVMDSWTPSKYTELDHLNAAQSRHAAIYSSTYSEGITNLLEGVSCNYKLSLAVMKQAKAIGVEFRSKKYKEVRT